jgi:autotransporter-associated beta strand protein
MMLKNGLENERKNFSTIGYITAISNSSVSLINANGVITPYTLDMSRLRKIETYQYVPLAITDLKIDDRIILQGLDENEIITITRIISFTSTPASTGTTTDNTASSTDPIINTGTTTPSVATSTNATSRVTTLSGLSGFAGTVQVGSASTGTGDKLDMAGAQAPQTTVQIENGHTLYVGSDGAPVRLSAVTLGGSGNAENRGALRFASNASKLEAAVSLVSDATIASDSAAATLEGTISGTAGAGATHVLTQGTTASAVGLTVSGMINDGSNGGRVALVQSKGKLTLTTNNTYSGVTTINGGGTLQLGANDALPISGAVILGGTNGIGNGVGNLTLGNYSQTIDSLLALSIGTAYNTITIAPEQVLTISGTNGLFVGLDAGVGSETRVKMTGGGALAVTHANANVTLGKGQSDEAGTGTGVLDLSELGSVTLGSSIAPINELRVAYGQMSSGTLTLSNTNNLITANTVNIGNSFLLNAGTGTMILGSGVNTLSANTINIGLYKGNATVKFAAQTPGSAGSVTVTGKNKPTADIVIGSKGAMPSGAVTVGVLDLRGHEATIAAGSVTIGREDNATGNVYTGGAMGWLYFDGGTFSMTNLVMAYKSGINTGVNARATATLTVSGGEFIIAEGGTFSFASQTGTGIAIATNNILGGTFRSYADIRTGASNCLSVINLDGGTLDMTRHAIGVGAQTVTVFNVRSGTVMNLGQFNNGAPLVKTGSGSFTLAGTNTYTGATIISNGVVRLTGGACLPQTADLYLASGTTCELDYTGTLSIHALYINGERKRGSFYSAANLPDVLTGTGTLTLPYMGSMMILR